MATRSEGKHAMRERILAAADRLFYGQGIRAVGVDTVAAKAGISKRTLYNHFPTKGDLIAAYLSRRSAPLPASGDPPGAQILAAFDRLERMFAGADFRGCPFVNAVSELGAPRHPVRKLALRFKEQRRTWFRALLVELGVSDPEGLATQLHLLSEGAIAAALVRGDPGVARSAKDAARTLLVAAGVKLA
jgi:AcrR family transcriptional regulator